MKIRSVLYGGIALISFCLFFSGFSPEPESTSVCLKVPFVPQLGKNWCWAACTEMITTYYHNEVDPKAPLVRQCDEVKAFFGKTCTLPCPPPDTIPKVWDTTGEPFTPDFGYSPKYWGNPLPWDTLCTQIGAKKPVIFQWYWSGITKNTVSKSGSHFLVAEGCLKSSYINAPGWVSIHDPLPVKRGRHRIIAYTEYANTTPITYPGYKKYVFNSHGTDMYDINYMGSGK